MPIPTTFRARSTGSRPRGSRKDKGMRAIVLKSHFDPTAGLALLARKAAPGIEVFGGIDLNLPVGGMNAHAVEHMAQVNGGWGRIVWMSTFDSENQVRTGKSNAPFVRVSQNGELLPETKAVIAAIAKHNLVLASGHVSAQEALLMFEEGHASSACAAWWRRTACRRRPRSRVEQAQQATRLGVFIEFVSGTLASAGAQAKVDRIADDIRKVGVEHAILSSDLGQARQPAAGRRLRDVHRCAAQERVHRSGARSHGEREPGDAVGVDRFPIRRPHARSLFAVLDHCRSRAVGARRSVARSRLVFLYAAVGPELSTYAVSAPTRSLTKTSSVTLPFAVQYVWHASVEEVSVRRVEQRHAGRSPRRHRVPRSTRRRRACAARARRSRSAIGRCI